ncbi:MAG: hypothetical protein HY934_01225 [Candidatus Firestonebacteria bacterium]|nr:hypothetical protein [Candidatus Firestonebacteria bacterium]
MSDKQIKDIINKKPYLFWYVHDIESLSTESIIEAILCRGDFNDFLELIEIIGIGKVAEIFSKQISKNRSNYSKKTENYFNLFFKKHIKNV